MNRRIFIATPISGFVTEEDYKEYRVTVLKLICFLREHGFEVYSELEKIDGAEDYDSPAKSVEEDFKRIRENEFFVLLHPARMQTSSLIELGYACALDKKIVFVGRRNDFPYLVTGYEDYSNKAIMVETGRLSEEGFSEILNALITIQDL